MTIKLLALLKHKCVHYIMKESKEKNQLTQETVVKELPSNQPSLLKLVAKRALIGGVFNINLKKNQVIEVSLSKDDLNLDINAISKLSQSGDTGDLKKAFILESITSGALSIINI